MLRRVLFLVLWCLVSPAAADSLKLKSGQTINGTILESNDKFVKMDLGFGIPLTYYVEDIAEIWKTPTRRAQPTVTPVAKVWKRNTYRVTKNFHFRYLTILSSFKFSYPLPRNDVAHQRISDIKITPSDGYQIKPDANGFQAMIFSFNNVGVGQEMDISLSYVVDIEDDLPTIDPKKITPLTDEQKAQLAVYLKGDEDTPLGDQNFAAIVDAILKGANDPYDQAKAVYDYLVSTIHYEDRLNRESFQRPLDTFSRGRGNCVDMSLLFVSVARMSGIPARLVSGFVFQRRDESATTLVSQTGHTWAEIYFSGYGWVPVDPTFGMKYKDKYFAFPYERHIREFYGPFFSRDSGAVYRGNIEATPLWGVSVASSPVEQKLDLSIELISGGGR